MARDYILDDCSMAATVEHGLLINNLFSGYFTVMRHTTSVQATWIYVLIRCYNYKYKEKLLTGKVPKIQKKHKSGGKMYLIFSRIL